MMAGAMSVEVKWAVDEWCTEGGGNVLLSP